MTARFTTSRAIGAAIALTLGTAATAAAQSTAATTAAIGGTTDSLSAMPSASYAPAPAVASEALVAPAAPTSAQPPMGQRTGRFGNGVYFGLAAGANFPQNNINNVYDPGFNAGAQLGWDPANGPIGLRLNVTYNQLNGRRDVLSTTPAGARIEQDLPDAKLWSAFADTKLRLPFGRFFGATSGLYALGGVGLTQFQDYQSFQNQTGTPVGGSVVNFDPNGGRNSTRFAINGGGGLSWGLGSVSLFAEGRYVRVFTQGRDTDYVPVTIGLSFH
jgi:hypothetical protein